MPEESTTPDLVGRWRSSFEAVDRGDVEAALGIWAPDGVWDISPMGLGVYEGLAATRGFFEDWLGNYDEFRIEVEQMIDLGNGVTLAVIVQRGRPVGSDGEVQLRYATVALWAEGLIVRVTNYGDPDEARAAAERLARERA
jgi:ketosteroid isomerase-like protein